jgi:hypothetical protein
VRPDRRAEGRGGQVSQPIKSDWDLGRPDDHLRQCLAFATSKYIRLEAEVAALQAENKRIGKLFADTERMILLDGEFEAAKVGTYAALQAENERLRKAGDAVIEKLAEAYAGEPSDFDHAHVFKAWLAAKGVQP